MLRGPSDVRKNGAHHCDQQGDHEQSCQHARDVLVTAGFAVRVEAVGLIGRMAVPKRVKSSPMGAVCTACACTEPCRLMREPPNAPASARAATLGHDRLTSCSSLS